MWKMKLVLLLVAFIVAQSLVQGMSIYSMYSISFMLKGSGFLMTRLYKEKPKSWDTCNLVLTFQVLNCSKIAFLQPIYMI